MASIENVIPILRVEDLEGRRYYMQELGFALDWDYAGQNDLGVRAITRG
jgi:hypothetical protein